MFCNQVLGTNHLKALAALQLRVLDLRNIPWAENSISMGLVSLVAGMPCLRVLGAPDRVLVRQQRKQPGCLMLLCCRVAAWALLLHFPVRCVCQRQLKAHSALHMCIIHSHLLEIQFWNAPGILMEIRNILGPPLPSG